MLRLIAAAGLLLLALFMLLGFFVADLGELSAPVVVLTLLVTVALPAAGAVALLWGRLSRRGRDDARLDELRRATFEAELLRLAGERGGKLTVAEVVADQAVDEATAESALRALVDRGHAELELSESGVIVYAFRHLAAADEKARARGVLDA